MPYNDKDLKKILPKSSPLEKDLKGSLEYLNSMTDGDGVNDKDKPGFDSQAFKHAIGMIESSGGKFLDSKSSSAAGKYHFLWNLIKDNESLNGMSKTEFIANPDIQEQLMDQALNGKLEGYPNYIKYATSLKSRYGSELKTSQIAALTHFLGSGNVKKYLSNPDEFKVKGVNLSPEKYMQKYDQYATEYRAQYPEKSSDENLGPVNPKDSLVEQTMQPIDNTAVNMHIQARPPAQEGTFRLEDQGVPSGLEFNNELREGGQAHVSQASDLVTEFEGGGTHEENPLGGIPQGVGANGKLNLVEEGETKWNGYIFSNAYDMEGNFTGKDGNKSNVFEGGGNLNCGGPGQPPCEREKLTAKEEKSVMDYIDNQDKESAMQQMRDRADSQSMRASDPEATFVDKAFNVLASPMSAMTRGNSAGNLNVNMDNRNPFDDVLDTVNPFAWGQYASASKDSFDKGEYLDAGFNALGAIPIVPAWAAKGKKVIPSIKKGVTKSASKVKNSDLVSNNVDNALSDISRGDVDFSEVQNVGSTLHRGSIPKNPMTGNGLFDLLHRMTGGGKKEVEKLRPLISELAEGSTTSREVFDFTLANLKSPQGQKRLYDESLLEVTDMLKNSPGGVTKKKLAARTKEMVERKMKEFSSVKNVNETLKGSIKGDKIKTNRAINAIYKDAGGGKGLFNNAGSMNGENPNWYLGTNFTKSKPTAAHELTHKLQFGNSTELDKQLKDLPQLKSKDVANQDYYNALKGREPRAFAAELRQSMFDRGILKNSNGTWDDITEDMLKKSVKSFKNKPSGSMVSNGMFVSNTRILDIIDPKGFKDLAKLMNKLTGAVVPVAIGASQLSSGNENRLGGLVNMYENGGKIDSTNSPSPKNKVTKKSKPKTKENFDNYKLS